MPRRAKCRRVSFVPEINFFSPVGHHQICQDEVVLSVEEFEALRLKDYLNLEQEEAARQMHVSRQTYQRVLGEAHFKIADALTNGKGIRIQGGNFCLGDGYCRRRTRFLAYDESCQFEKETQKKDRSEAELGKIAITAAGGDPEANIDARFGRCSHFMLWDPQSSDFTAIENKGGEAAHGAGTGAAQLLLKNQAQVLITNKIGPKAFAALKSAGIKVFSASETETITGALKKYLHNQLEQLNEPNN